MAIRFSRQCLAEDESTGLGTVTGTGTGTVSSSDATAAAAARYVAMLRHECPHVAASLAAVSRILRRRQHQMIAVAPTPALSALLASRCHTELEGRLGRVLVDEQGRRRFVPGVSADFMARLLAMLEPSTVWCETQPWTQSIDRMYSLANGVHVRTTSSLRYNGADQSASAAGNANATPTPQLAVTHITKTRVASVDLQWRVAAASMAAAADTGFNYDVRVSLNDEAAVPVTEFPVRIDAVNLVRIKQRRSFRYKPAGESAALWSIDLTLVWSAPTHLEALRALRNNVVPVYEVEIECLRPQSLLGDRRQVTGVDVLALSLLLKIADLFGPLPPHAALVPL